MDFPVTGTWLARTTGLPDGLCTNVVKAAESELGSLNLNLGRHFVQKVQLFTKLRRAQRSSQGYSLKVPRRSCEARDMTALGGAI